MTAYSDPHDEALSHEPPPSSGDELLRASFRRARRVAFGIHLLVFIVVNFALMIMALRSDETWFIYILLGWGMLLAVHGFSLLDSAGLSYDNQFQQWKSFEPSEPTTRAH